MNHLWRSTFGNRKAIWAVLAIAVHYIPVMIIIMNILPEEPGWLIGIVHMAYGAFFVEWTWKKSCQLLNSTKTNKSIDNKQSDQFVFKAEIF
ncbi:MAG: hypothetical protein RIG77_10475 [Cyclobacteriaceae bacterium]